MNTPAKIQLAGQSVKVRVSSRPLKGCHGYARKYAREIVISKGLSRRQLLEVVLHEMQHMQQWYLDEEIVETMAAEQAEALIALGLYDLKET